MQSRAEIGALLGQLADIAVQINIHDLPAALGLVQAVVERDGVAARRLERAFDQLVRTAIDRGVNFMDNSWDYNNGNGQGEIKMGKALRDGYRQKVL